MSERTSRRQLILLCDGTNNSLTGRKADTHVVLLAEVLRRHPDPQGRLVYYDPGVGNSGQLPGTTVMDKLARKSERIGGLAFGRGVFDNIAEGYRFLMRKWQPGDEIWLFGFSRGAFTARSIGGLVNSFGILDEHQETMVPNLVAAYFSDDTEARRQIRAQTTRLFAQGDEPAARPIVHFVGVWDTVATVGVPPFDLRIKARPDLRKKHFRHVRHALALDEHRAQFRPRAYAEDNGSFLMAGDQLRGSIRQRWFRGSHCDVGGGNPYPHSEQARAPFAWMLVEAAACGLRLLPAGQSVDEARALEMIAAVDPVPPGREPARLASEIWSTPLWALTGLAARDTVHVAMDGDEIVTAETDVDASANHGIPVFPEGTVWHGHWSAWRWTRIAIAALLMMGMPLLLGYLLVGKGASMQLAGVGDYLAANDLLQRWQLNFLACPDEWVRALKFTTPSAVAVATTVDFLFIAVWAYFLAHVVTPAFAFLVGRIKHGEKPRRVANALGWMLPLAIGADVLENLLTLLALTLLDCPWLSWPLRVLLALVSLAKWLALLGVLALAIGGGSRWLRSFSERRAARSQPS